MPKHKLINPQLIIILGLRASTWWLRFPIQWDAVSSVDGRCDLYLLFRGSLGHTLSIAIRPTVYYTEAALLASRNSVRSLQVLGQTCQMIYRPNRLKKPSRREPTASSVKHAFNLHLHRRIWCTAPFTRQLYHDVLCSASSLHHSSSPARAVTRRTRCHQTVEEFVSGRVGYTSIPVRFE